MPRKASVRFDLFAEAERLYQRHRTAIRRTTLSRPLSLALDAGLIDHDIIVLDYGCGRGDDLRGLRAQSIQCYGWDPVYCPEGERQEADVVNLGYVVNVIEDPDEHSQTLCESWKFAQRVLIVAARLTVEANTHNHKQYNDGFDLEGPSRNFSPNKNSVTGSTQPSA